MNNAFHKTLALIKFIFFKIIENMVNGSILQTVCDKNNFLN